MASNADIKQHISIAERAKWNQVIVDFNTHKGAGGVENHMLANGTTPGFSTEDFTTAFKEKLIGIQDNALYNPHPKTHSWTMIDGLVKIANTGSWNDLVDIPSRINDVVNGVADAWTIRGIRITIASSGPSNPQVDKEIWIDTSALVMKIYTNAGWQIVGAAYR